MEYFVYVIYSESAGLYYKGTTSYPDLRLAEHNHNKGRYTAGKGPWKLVYLQRMFSKREALILEHHLKRSNVKYLRWLIDQDTNLVRDQACHPD